MLEGLQEIAVKIGEDVKSFINEKPITSASIGAGVVAIGSGVAILKGVRKKSKRKATKRGKKRTTKKGRSRDRKFKSKEKHEQQYKRKKKYKIYKKKGYHKADVRKSKKRMGKIYYTKKGQPYKIMMSGKARFIKKRR